MLLDLQRLLGFLLFVGLAWSGANAQTGPSQETQRIDELTPKSPEIGEELRAPLPELEEEGPKARDYKIGSVIELRSVQNRMPQRDPKLTQGIYEMSLSGQYQIDKTLGARVNLSIEKLDEISKLYIKEAYFNWRPYKNWLELRGGQQFMSVGLFNRMDNFFSSQPEYVEMLFTSTKGIDVGVEARVYPWQQEWIYVEGGQYAGQVLREQDQRHGTPTKAPQFLSLKSKNEFYEVFATYFEHHLAFFNPIRAFGAGFELRGSTRWSVRPRLIGETWAFSEMQRSLGPTQQNRAYSLYGGLEWWKMAAGVRFSGNSVRMVSKDTTDVLAPQRGVLYHVDISPVKALRFRVERVMEAQQLLARDEWVYRAILNWSL